MSNTVFIYTDGTTSESNHTILTKSSYTNPITKYLKSVIVGTSCSSLGQDCFRDMHLISITIPNSVTSLGTNCFYQSTNLTSITIPDSVTFLGEHCFRGCTKLTSIVITNFLANISNSCFQGCSSLTSILIPNTVKSLGNNCFTDCTSLSSIIYANPSGITSAGVTPFLNTPSMKVNFFLTPLVPSTPSGVYTTSLYTSGTTFNYISISFMNLYLFYL